MLHELIFLGCHSQFASYPYTFASYSHSCEILQPYVAPTVRMHFDAVVSSAGTLSMKTVNNKWSTFTSPGFGCRMHVNQSLQGKPMSPTFRVLMNFTRGPLVAVNKLYDMIHIERQ